MNVFFLSSRTAACALSLLAVGCANYPAVTASNGTTAAVPVPRIETVNKVANVEVGESINGTACRTSVFGFFVSGDTHLLLSPDQPLNSELDKTKAAAGFEALFSKIKDHPPIYHDPLRPFPNDMLVAPTYHVKETNNGLEKQICVTVTAYRGRIKTFNDADTTTATPLNAFDIINIQAINPSGRIVFKGNKTAE